MCICYSLIVEIILSTFLLIIFSSSNINFVTFEFCHISIFGVFAMGGEKSFGVRFWKREKIKKYLESLQWEESLGVRGEKLAICQISSHRGRQKSSHMKINFNQVFSQPSFTNNDNFLILLWWWVQCNVNGVSRCQWHHGPIDPRYIWKKKTLLHKNKTDDHLILVKRTKTEIVWMISDVSEKEDVSTQKQN